MFEKEKLSGNNFNDWFARLKLVLRVEKKMHVIEQPLPPAPKNYIDSLNALSVGHDSGAVRSMFEKQAGVRIRRKNKGNQGKGTRKVYIPKPSNQKSAANEPQLKDMPATTVRSNKRVKHNLDSTYLWHCRLAHINKKRIKQLQQDGLLKSTDDESFDKCESCLSGKEDKEPSLIALVKERYAYKLEQKDLQEISGRAVDLEEIQEEEDTTPSEITIAPDATFSRGALDLMLRSRKNDKPISTESSKLRVACYCDADSETDRDDTKVSDRIIFINYEWRRSGFSERRRHYQRRYHYVRECVELGEIRILKVHTDNNLADPFTKALSNRKLTQHARGMGLRPASSFM
ncbi:retrotransposon protein, putative, ty1-copia subclass [Tanacetum coccineum]